MAVRIVLISVCAALLAGAAAAAEQAPQDLPAPVVKALKRHALPAQSVSVYVHEIGSAEPLVAHLADTPRNPASVMKLLTTLAALEELGPAYSWKTEAFATAPVRAGRLEGDLYLKGYGDPYLVIEHFWRFLRQLRVAGVEEIAGDLVIDQSYFEPVPDDPADFDGRPQRAYNVLPTALLVNFQAVNFRLVPDRKRVRVLADPWPAQLELDNRLRLTRERCRGAARDVGVKPGRKGERELVVVQGKYAAACGEQEIFRVVSKSVPYIHGVFKAVWTELGGRFQGNAREGLVPPDARLLVATTSPPLSDIVRSINKYSNNVMTRQVLLTLGAERAGPPGSIRKGVEAVQGWLARRGLVFPELVLENGAGLSREERISARSLARLLLAGYESPYMPEFMSSLPISAQDGTLRQRFTGTPLEGRVHLKTGSIDYVRSMAGYVLDRHGRRVVVVSLHSHPRLDTASGEAVQEELLRWVYERPARTP